MLFLFISYYCYHYYYYYYYYLCESCVLALFKVSLIRNILPREKATKTN